MQYLLLYVAQKPLQEGLPGLRPFLDLCMINATRSSVEVPYLFV